ncbi:alpha/beta fold hydrolase [Halalkalibacter okhensis]|uniref:Hydrolase n=1 Tax=Halalkalibacter okhensis TaxID=333138 RepID=A0A0B0IGS8_9BACI|nr:alpha/beta hydrolase [Halalkalibacter okhensis]KHF39264.1 hydrolase [Halalkalibacter okhensis]
MDLHYQEYGNKDGSLLVFLHGGGVSSWMWDKQIQYFSDYHCVAIDLPEQGKSKDVTPFSIKISAEKVIDCIKYLAKETKVIVVGFSLGAQVIVQMLSMKPNLIDYAIINSALVRPNWLASKLISPIVELTFPLIKNKSFSKLQAKTLYVEKDHFEIYYKESSNMKSETLITILQENMAFKIPEDFNKANSRILVTVGEREKAIMKSSAKDLVLNNPNCTGIIIPKVGHGISMNNPEFFNQMIKHWIEKSVLPRNVVAIK